MVKRKTREAEGWEAPSSFNKLVKSLKKSSKNRQKSLKLPKPQTAEDVQVDEKVKKRARKQVETEDIEEGVSEQKEGEALEEDASEVGSEGEEVEDDEDAEEANEDEEEDDDVAGIQSTDHWERHFGDHVSEGLVFQASAVDSADLQWISEPVQDPELEVGVQLRLKTASHPSTHKAGDATLEDFTVKQRLHEPWQKLNGASWAAVKGDSTNATAQMTPLQASLFPHVNEYQDVMFAKQTHANSAQLRQMYALHAMNHVFKTRDRVLKNTTKLKSEAADDLDLRDQGFTRPKVLIIVPFKHTALEIVKMLIALSGTKQQDNKKRFFEEFGLPPEDDTVDPKKSEDFKKTFAGNIDDCFRMGIKFSRKQLKLFADFYSSDIIIASPLGLRMVIGAEGEKKRDFDYLSAIEVVIMDSADVFLMQNWDHVQHIFEHLNLIPKDPHGCDFSRVRAYYLDGRAKYVRQTLIFSRLLTPEMNALLTTHCKNVAGKLKIKPRYTQGSIADVVITVPQIFHRVPCASPIDADDARFTYFVEKILPTLRQSVVQQKHSMIFVPSYFDFVRVKKYLEEHNYNSVQLCEYTPRREISGARGEFFRGEASYMLYTERFHFFRRYRIKGIRHLVFYALPDYSDTFYPEMVNMLESDASKDVTCTVLYTKYDRLKLERVVGSRRVGHMIEGAKDAFMFVEEK